MSTSHDAVVAGHLCLDVIPDLTRMTSEQFQRSFAPGRLMEIGAVSFSTGGPVSNVGLALYRLGIKTELMGKVGEDVFGQAILQLASSYDPNLIKGMIVDSNVASSYTLVFTPPDFDRILMHYPGANDTFRADDIHYERLHQARLFHFGYPPLMRRMYENAGIELTEIFKQAKETGITTSLDLAVPDPSSAAGRADWHTILSRTLPYVDVFLPSIEEILYMLRRDLFEELHDRAKHGDILPLITPALLSDFSTQLLEMGPTLVALKLGYRGFYMRTADETAITGMGRAQPTETQAWAHQELWVPCFKASVAGTAGAGDSTIAGFLSALLRDVSPEEAVRAAVAVGGCNVEAADTLSGLRSWEDTLARVAGGWKQHEMTIEEPGWSYDDNWHLWKGPRVAASS